LCYVLFVAAFALDPSITLLVYLLGMLLVPLLAQQPVRLYWKALLVYTEVLLILQYSYLTVARCLCIPGDSASGSSSGSGDSTSSGGSSSGCVWVLQTDPAATRHAFEVLGLHRTSAGVLPLFLIYLAVLIYNYTLSSKQPLAALPLRPGPAVRGCVGVQHAQGESRDAAARDGAATYDTPEAVRPRSGPAGDAADSRNGGAGAAVMLLVALQGWVGQLWTLSWLLLLKVAYHVRYVFV
jgi:hypothetical protein